MKASYVPIGDKFVTSNELTKGQLFKENNHTPIYKVVGFDGNIAITVIVGDIKTGPHKVIELTTIGFLNQKNLVLFKEVRNEPT